MKKILYLALCSLLLAGLIMCFAACGDDEEPTGSSSSKPDSSSSVADSSTGSSTTDSSGSNDSTDSSVGGAGSSTDSSVPTTDSSNSGTDSTSPSTGSSAPTTDSSTQDPPVDDHKHTFSDVYSYDDQNHYYKATCEHKDEVDGTEPHSFDENGDCKCGYHQHTYSNEYSYDADNHFNKATCIHTEEIANVEAHSYNEQNVCKCGKVKDAVQDIIATIVANKGSITNGTSVQTTYDNRLGSVSASNIVYKFYDNYVYVKQEEDYINEYYYSYDDGKLIAIFVQNGGNVNVDTEASEDNLSGARYILGCVEQYETYACGSESLVEFFYKNGIEKASDTFVAAKNGNEYTMSYGYCIVDDWANYYYLITAAFTVDEATSTLKTASITVDRFAMESYTVVDGKYIINDGAEPNFKTTFEIAQNTEALENVDNPYDSSKILLDSIAVKDRDGNDIEEIVIKQRANDEIKIFLADITPSTALLSLCDIELIVKNEADGSVVEVSVFYNDYDKSYSFNINMPGVYEISLRVNDMTFVTTAEISAKIPAAIAAQVYDATTELFNKTKKAEVYAGAPLYLMSYVESGFDGAYTATLVGENAGNASLTDGEIGGKAVTVFKSDVLDEYTVKIEAEADKTVSCLLTVTVVEAPSVEDLLFGEYFANDDRGNRIVTAIFGDNSIVDITYAGIYGEETTQLSYTVANNTISFEVTDGDEFVEEFYINELYQVVMVIYEEAYVLEQVFVETTLVSSGSMKVEDIAGNGKYSNTYAFELYSNGEFVIFNGYSRTNDVSLTKKNGSYMFKLKGADAQPLVKTSGDANSLAGEYSIDGIVNVTITLDSVATPVMEPQYGTLEVVDHVATTSDRNKSFVYGYEIIDGEFVFYRYGEVTENVSLVKMGNEYSFQFENLANAMVMEKVEGADDILGGEYVIEKFMPGRILFAEIIITPGAQGPQKPVIIEEPYGMFMLDDKVDGTLTGTYNYEIVDGEFVVYKDGVLTTDVTVIKDGDNVYLQCGSLTAPMMLVKIEGEEFALAGYYEAQTETECIYAITFVPGILDDEEATGTLVIEDNYNGTVGGTYSYEIFNGSFLIYKDGVLTNDVLIMQTLDGTYTFQCVGTVPLELVKVEGISVVLEGKYVVNGDEGALFTLTFTPGGAEDIPVYVEEGTIEVTDNKDGTASGSYTYKVTDDGAFYIFKNGVLTNDIIISIVGEDNYTFQSPAMTLPQTLVMIKGESGMISGKYQVLEGEEVIYEVLILKNGYELPIVYVEEGTIEVTDNNGNTVGGSYTYKITDEGNIVIFKDGIATSDIVIVAGANGEYTFKCAALENAQELVMVKGEDNMFSGKYQITSGDTVLYELLILKNGYELPVIYVEEGTLEIVDSNEGTLGGSYIYKITDEGVFHIFKDGVIVDSIAITAGENDTYFFWCSALEEPVALGKVKGEYGMLSGGYRISEGDTVKYDVVILKNGYELPGATVQDLVIGQNEIFVNDAESGATVIYTSSKDGSLIISDLSGNAMMYIVYEDNLNNINFSSKINVLEGETITIVFKTKNQLIDVVRISVGFENKNNGVTEGEGGEIILPDTGEEW